MFRIRVQFKVRVRVRLGLGLVRTELGSGEIRVRVRVRVRVRISPHRTGLRRNEGTGVPEHILLISYFVSRRLLGANCIKRLSALQ